MKNGCKALRHYVKVNTAQIMLEISAKNLQTASTKDPEFWRSHYSIYGHKKLTPFSAVLGHGFSEDIELHG